MVSSEDQSLSSEILQLLRKVNNDILTIAKSKGVQRRSMHDTASIHHIPFSAIKNWSTGVVVFLFLFLQFSTKTYKVSQYIILKSGLSLMMNVSLSIRSSVMVGGGRATAIPTIPIMWDCNFLLTPKHDCCRICPVMYTTWWKKICILNVVIHVEIVLWVFTMALPTKA